MSYLVLARKYRPQLFDEVVGQDHVTRTLIHAIEASRVAHAILFSGPRGTGKTTVARILAKAMNCEHGPTKTPCNKCQSCREVTNDNAADVLEIDGASNNSVDQVRELRDNIVFLPNTARFKIYIIDEVHMLTTSAFNALLKTLEEPPSHVLFMFATTEIKKIPITILSRCQRHDMRRIEHHAIRTHLESICTKEEKEVDADSLSLIARQADGSMRDALSLLDQVMAGCKGAVSVDFVRDIIGGADTMLLSGLCDTLFSQDAEAMLKMISEIYQNGQDLQQVYSDLLVYFRDLTVIKASKSAEKIIDRSPDEMSRMVGQVESISQIFLSEIFDRLCREENMVRFSAHPRMAIEMVLLKIIGIPPVIPMDTLIEKLDTLKNVFTSAKHNGKGTNRDKKPTGIVKTDRDPLSGLPQANRTIESTDRRKKNAHASRSAEKAWRDILQKLEETSPSLVANLQGSRLLTEGNNQFTIELEGAPFNLEMVLRKKKQVEECIRQVFGANATVRFMADAKGETKKPARAAKNGDFQKKALSHPIVKDAIEIFNGKVDKIDIFEEES